MSTATELDYVRTIVAQSGGYGPTEAWTTLGCEEGVVRHVNIQLSDGSLELVVREGDRKTSGKPLNTQLQIHRPLTPEEAEYIRSQLIKNKEVFRLKSSRIEQLEAHFGL